MKAPKDILSIRIDPDLLEKAKASGINVSALFQSLFEKYMKEIICPTCRQKVKK